MRQPGHQVPATHVNRPSVYGSHSLRALPDDSVPDAVADKLSYAFSYALPDTFSHSFPHALPHALPDEVPYAVSNPLPHEVSDTTSGRLRDERVWEMGNVFQNVRWRHSGAPAHDTPAACFWWQGVRCFGVLAPV